LEQDDVAVVLHSGRERDLPWPGRRTRTNGTRCQRVAGGCGLELGTRLLLLARALEGKPRSVTGTSGHRWLELRRTAQEHGRLLVVLGLQGRRSQPVRRNPERALGLEKARLQGERTLEGVRRVLPLVELRLTEAEAVEGVDRPLIRGGGLREEIARIHVARRRVRRLRPRDQQRRALRIGCGNDRLFAIVIVHHVAHADGAGIGRVGDGAAIDARRARGRSAAVHETAEEHSGHAQDLTPRAGLVPMSVHFRSQLP
jgi:hypothetical protein